MREDQFVPQLIVSNGSAAMDFYVKAFGAEQVSRTMTPDGKKLVHGELKLDNHLLFVSDEVDASQGGSLQPLPHWAARAYASPCTSTTPTNPSTAPSKRAPSR